MEIVQRLSRLPTSGEDVYEIAGGKTKIITYPEIKKYRTMDQLLGKNESVIILYLTRENYGHWISLFRRSDGILEFFDPYGIFVDDQLEWVKDEDFKHKKNMEFPYVLRLLESTGEPIEYNNYAFQKRGDNISTCGRHAALRVRFKNLKLEEYKDFIKEAGKLFNIKDKDLLITVLSEILRK